MVVVWVPADTVGSSLLLQVVLKKILPGSASHERRSVHQAVSSVVSVRCKWPAVTGEECTTCVDAPFAIHTDTLDNLA